jgi:hypothetical protein
MSKEIKYVPCKWCPPSEDASESELDSIQHHKCHHCKGERKVQDPSTILCNMCGETMCPLGTMNEQIPHGLYQAKVMGGFDSYHLLDMNKYIFNFCEKCLRDMFYKCKLPPEVREMSFDEGDLGVETPYEDDLKSYEYRVWKDNGGHHQAYLNKTCNLVKDCPNKAVYTRLYNGHIFTEDCCCEEHKGKKSYKNIHYVKFIPDDLRAFL